MNHFVISQPAIPRLRRGYSFPFARILRLARIMRILRQHEVQEQGLRFSASGVNPLCISINCLRRADEKDSFPFVPAVIETMNQLFLITSH